MRDLTRVILHCSATPDYTSNHPSVDRYGRKEIDQWHRDKGWQGCGYHYIIRRGRGIIEMGRDISIQGAHVSGENSDSIGICYIGTQKPTMEQLESIQKIFWFLFRTYDIDWRHWYCHNEFTKRKTCPGFSGELLRQWLSNVRDG